MEQSFLENSEGKTVDELIKEVNKEKYFMTGAEFRFIREKWGIAQTTIAKLAGYKSHVSIMNKEFSDYVNYRIGKHLINLIGEEDFLKMREIYKISKDQSRRKFRKLGEI